MKQNDGKTPGDRLASSSDSQALLLIATKLDRMAQLLAEIHQMVSPPETQEGASLTDLLAQMAKALEAVGSGVEALHEGQGALSGRMERIEGLLRRTGAAA